MSAEGAAARPQESDVLTVLTLGELAIQGRIVGSSNAAMLVSASLDGVEVLGAYKPVRGERPLWDFPTHTLARRERAAYVLSAATGWDVVPPTVLREGPYGEGSVQWWIDGGSTDGVPDQGEPGAGIIDVVAPGDVPEGWLHVIEAEDGYGEPVVLAHADDVTLRHMSVFDVMANNTDRKGGHVLRHPSGAVYGIDHGLTFNVEDKLRTVLWGWAGRRLPSEVVGTLQRVCGELARGGPLREQLGPLLSRAEIDRTLERAENLCRTRRHPRPAGGWPSIPWPAF